MKAERGEADAKDKFEASRGSFLRFKERSHLRNIKVQDEAVSANVETAESYPVELAKELINGYSEQPVFSVDEAALYWKKVPSRMFLALTVEVWLQRIV